LSYVPRGPSTPSGCRSSVVLGLGGLPGEGLGAVGARGVLGERRGGLVDPGAALGAGRGDLPAGLVVDDMVHYAHGNGRWRSAQQCLGAGLAVLLVLGADELRVVPRVALDGDLGLMVLRVVTDLYH